MGLDKMFDLKVKREVLAKRVLDDSLTCEMLKKADLSFRSCYPSYKTCGWLAVSKTINNSRLSTPTGFYGRKLSLGNAACT
jgi:hypothetical protein